MSSNAHKANDAIVQGTVTFFQTMIGADVTPGPAKDGVGVTFSPGISAVIGMSGDLNGSMALHIPSEVAENIIEGWLGERLPGSSQDARDAVGEITNIVLGDAKTTMSSGNLDISLSIPNVIAGMEYEFTYPKDATVFTTQFSGPFGEFAVEVAVRNL